MVYFRDQRSPRRTTLKHAASDPTPLTPSVPAIASALITSTYKRFDLLVQDFFQDTALMASLHSSLLWCNFICEQGSKE